VEGLLQKASIVKVVGHGNNQGKTNERNREGQVV